VIEIGCCAHGFRGWTLEQAARHLSECGFVWISPGANAPTAQLDPVRIAREPDAVADEALAVAEKYGVKYVELFMCQLYVDGRGTEPNDPDTARLAAMLKAFRGICRFAHRAGFRDIMGVPGGAVAGEAAEASWKRAIATQKAMVEIAGEEGACYAIEPYRRSILQSPADITRMLEEVPGLRLALDYCHYIGMGYSLEQLLPFHQWAVHVHIKPCGTGVFKALVHEDQTDWRPAIEDLLRRKWDGVVSTECIYDTRRPTLTQNAVFQNILLAHKIEMILKGIISEAVHV
jgi:sugar phosphate isomerase/epimerase